MNEYTRAFLDKVRERGDCLGLESIKAFLNTLGNPQNNLRVIQVAGTNGKGSVCCYLSSILKNSGYRVGTFTSPAVFSEYERYAVNGQFIGSEKYDEIMGRIQAQYNTLEEASLPLPTIFEIETVASILYFSDCSCDICIYETGMGGDEDATNIFPDQILAVFTSIGLDHTRFLGNTIEEIARHKTGIMKAGGTAVSTPQDDGAGRVLEAEAGRLGAELTFSECEKFCFRLKMRGSWQLTNARTALLAVRKLSEKGFVIPESALEKGFYEAYWPGRLEKIKEDPEVYIDGAHNIPAFRALAGELKNNPDFCGKRICLVLGVLADKDIDEMIRILLPEAARVFTVDTTGPRAFGAQELAEVCRREGTVPVSGCSEYSDAARAAAECGCDIILCTGSLSILREISGCFTSQGPF